MPDSSAQPPSQEAGKPARRVWKRSWFPAAITFTVFVAYPMLMAYLGPQHVTMDPDAIHPDAFWQTLMQVEYEEVNTSNGKQWIPQFAQDIQDLNQKTVRASGYMIPLGYAEEQTHFLISAWPGDGCYFHLPGGPNSVIEVKAQRGMAFTYDTIEVEGKLELLRDDPYGLLYRMVDAQPVR